MPYESMSFLRSGQLRCYLEKQGRYVAFCSNSLHGKLFKLFVKLFCPPHHAAGIFYALPAHDLRSRGFRIRPHPPYTTTVHTFRTEHSFENWKFFFYQCAWTAPVVGSACAVARCVVVSHLLVFRHCGPTCRKYPHCQGRVGRLRGNGLRFSSGEAIG